MIQFVDNFLIVNLDVVKLFLVGNSNLFALIIVFVAIVVLYYKIIRKEK